MTGVTGQFDGQFWSNSPTWRQFDLHIYMTDTSCFTTQSPVSLKTNQNILLTLPVLSIAARIRDTSGNRLNVLLIY